MLVALLMIALAAGLCAYILAPSTPGRRRGAAPEWPPDWWEAFERDFRAYAARQAPGRRGLDRPSGP